MIVEDVNNPRDISQSVDLRTLRADVAERVFALRRSGRVDTSRRIDNFYRHSDFSEPSEIVSLNNDERVFAGPVDRPVFEANHYLAEVYLRMPKGFLTAVKTDLNLTRQRLAVDVPAKMSVSAGTVLSTIADVDFVHPVSLIIGTLQKYHFKSTSVVVDLYGGYHVGGAANHPLYAPGHIALIQPDGSLIIRDEKSDLTDFHHYEIEPSLRR